MTWKVSFCAAFREQYYPPAARQVMGLLEGFSIFSPSPRALMYLPSQTDFPFIYFFTVPHARLRKLSQVEPSSQHIPIRQTLLPPTEFEKTTSVSGNSVSLLYL